MPDYSAERAATLAKIRPRAACNLLALLHDAGLRHRSFIAGRYSEAALNFDETLAFLEEMGWVRAHNGTIESTGDVTSRIVAADDAQRDILFADAVLEAASPYKPVFAGYLSQFQRIGGHLVHRPNADLRLQEAAVRDFFMDLGAVTHHPDGDYFVLEQPFAACALWARNVLGPTASQFEQQVEDRSAIGRQAELVVVDWERHRVGPVQQHHVRHVSQQNPAACFDIQSVTVDGSEILPRFIEVKAVAVGSFEFHWSRAEIEAAEILGERYFLYLLPVVSQDAFDATRMEVIPNAYAEVLRNSAAWSTTVADTVCRKRESLAT